VSEQRFWVLEDSTEFKFVRKILWRRFPETAALLTDCLEKVDPFELVHPGNPDEYVDVVREIIVLLAPVNGVLRELSEDELDALVREGLTRCFGEIGIDDENRVQQLIALLADRR
jgi:hypothetical protein